MVYYALFMYYQLSASPLDRFFKWWTKVCLPLKDSSMHMRRAVRKSLKLGDNVKATYHSASLMVLDWLMPPCTYPLCVCLCVVLCVWCVEPFAAGDVVIAPRCRLPHLPQPSGNYIPKPPHTSRDTQTQAEIQHTDKYRPGQTAAEA
jgi:hypothetical protein